MDILSTSIPSRICQGQYGVFLLRLVIGSLLFSGVCNLQSQTVISKEYQVKAAFLYNFTHFIEWPSNTYNGTNAPLTIGILGKDPFGNSLDDIIQGEKVDGHPLTVKRFQTIDEIKGCHILFISDSEAKQLDDIFNILKGQSILTVGDFEGFARRGGMIRFVTDNNKIRFRINVDAAKAAHLSISSKLLRPAEIVAPGKD